MLVAPCINLMRGTSVYPSASRIHETRRIDYRLHAQGVFCNSEASIVLAIGYSTFPKMMLIVIAQFIGNKVRSFTLATCTNLCPNI